MAERIAETFPRRRARVARWLGVEAKGHPRIYLVDDHEGMRERAGAGVPDWAVAVTRRDDVLVFRLDRVGRSPAHSLDLVLKHEVVHQVITHLPGGRPPRQALPRWFEEGLCVHHAGVAYLEADTSLERLAAAGTLPGFADADAWFGRDGRSAAIAYRFGQAVVSHATARFGDGFVRRLFDELERGRAFEPAFRDATGVELAEFEEAWRADVTPSLPFVLFVLLENIELTLLVVGALLAALGYARWRWRREKAMDALGP